MVKKISNKLIISYITLIIILVAIIFLLLGSFLKTTHINIIKTEMSRYDALIDYKFNTLSITPFPSALLSDTVSELADIIKLRITVVALNGKVIADSEVKDFLSLENHQYRKEIIAALKNGTGYAIRYSNTLKTDMLYYATYKKNHVIRLSKPLYEVDKSLSSLKNIILNVSAFAVVFSIILIIIISLKITRPLKETLSFASDFAAGNYKRRILNYSNDEIGTLQKALNTMADTIVETIDDHILEHQKLEATLESISDGIAMVDSEKHIIIYNNSFVSMLGITGDPRGKQFFEIIRNSTLNGKINRSLQSGEKEIFDIEMGGERFYEAVINPIRAAKVLQGILIVLHDISEKRKIERIKSDLVSNVSHELKTPIAIVRGYLETVKENYENKTMTMSFIERAIENVDRQNALIQDIIKLSMIESTKAFEYEKIDLKIIIERCLDLVALKISNRGITVINNLDNGIDYSVTGNSFLAEEVFFNIIDNGINYNSEKGTLTVSSSDTADTLSINISDTGAGIPDEVKERIFERFYRVDKSRSRATGGTGLGLSIVKHAIMVLAWDITVNSGVSGSTFTITAKKEASRMQS